jgi:hypothetical protein
VVPSGVVLGVGLESQGLTDLLRYRRLRNIDRERHELTNNHGLSSVPFLREYHVRRRQFFSSDLGR